MTGASPPAAPNGAKCIQRWRRAAFRSPWTDGRIAALEFIPTSMRPGPDRRVARRADAGVPEDRRRVLTKGETVVRLTDFDVSLGAPAGPQRSPRSTADRRRSPSSTSTSTSTSTSASASAFDIVIDRTLPVMQNGEAREVTVEEALQHRTYQDAIGGNRAARREVLKMIAVREKWLAAKAPKHQPVGVRIEPTDPDNAHEALLLLGIAERDTRWNDPNDEYERLLLRPWAVQAALSRPGRRRLSAKEVSEIKRCTRDAETLRWPAGVRNEQDD